MRKTAIIAGLVFILSNAYGQDLELQKEFLVFEQTHKDSLSASIFIDSSFFSSFGMKKLPQRINREQVWQHPLNYNSKEFITVTDTRWRFKDNAEAKAFFRKFLHVNTDYGEELKSTLIFIDDVNSLKIFRENEDARKMNENSGFPTHTYSFMFIVNNLVAKIIVITNGVTSVDRASLFPREAARRMNSAH